MRSQDGRPGIDQGVGQQPYLRQLERAESQCPDTNSVHRGESFLKIHESRLVFITDLAKSLGEWNQLEKSNDRNNC